MRSYWYQLGLLGLLCWTLSSCGKKSTLDKLSGEELAQVYCSSCHLFPKPELLPQSAWRKVLTRMGPRLGIPSDSFDPYKGLSMQEQFLLESAHIYPSKPSLSPDHWKRIESYFLENSPDSLALPDFPDQKEQKVFEAQFPQQLFSGPPAVTLVEWDEKAQALFLGDWRGNLFKLDRDFAPAYHLQLPKPIIDIDRREGQFVRLLTIGQLYPHEGPFGALVEVNEEAVSQQQFVLGELSRPVNFLSTDLDKDLQEDFVVCSFGNNLGRFSWYEERGNTYEEQILKPVPGATQVFAEDLDGNGWTDLLVLFAQGDEGVSIFYNEEGVFSEDRVLRFPSVYGSNDMEWVDMNADGHKDLVLTNGDNGDHSNVLKPYHGVRIYLNDGQNQFEEAFFFPHFGAAKVRCRDFDSDGDLDMLVMSFFADYKRAVDQSLVYLENTGDLNFEPHQVPGAGAGRWMVMDAGDFDGDGDTDVLLGSFTLNSQGIADSTMDTWREGKRPLLFLENKTGN